jgi:hypothetical protein
VHLCIKKKKAEEPLQHTYSPLCDQAEENISTHPHLMCVRPADLDPDFTKAGPADFCSSRI